MKRTIIAGLATAALVSGGLGLGVGTAQADAGARHWCPVGSDPTAPGRIYGWDWHVCHTYYWVKSGQGNVPVDGSLRGSSLWDGDNPPAGSVLPPLRPPPPLWVP